MLVFCVVLCTLVVARLVRGRERESMSIDSVPYSVYVGRGRVDVFAGSRHVAQAVEVAGGCYFACCSEAGRWFGYEWERVTLADWAARWSGHVA